MYVLLENSQYSDSRTHHCCCYNHHNTHNTQSYGLSHEEPVIGSGNIFNLDDYKLRSKTIREHTRNYRNNRCDNNMVTHQRLVKSSSIDTLEVYILLLYVINNDEKFLLYLYFVIGYIKLYLKFLCIL
jgi:hypothetical protein